MNLKAVGGSGHWFDTRWLPLLAAGFASSCALFGWCLLRLYIPEAAVAWWTPWASAAVAIESVLVADLATRWEMPKTLRLAEAIAITGGSYLLAGGGPVFPRNTTLLEWATSPGAGSLATTALLFCAWYLASSSGVAFASMGSLPQWESSGGSGSTAPYDAETKRMTTPRLFERRLVFWLVALAALAAGAHESFPHRALEPGAFGWLVGMTAAGSGVLLFGLLLQGSASLHQRQSAWMADRLPISPRLPSRWMTSALASVAIAVAAALALPAGRALVSVGGLAKAFSEGVGNLMAGLIVGAFRRLMVRGTELAGPSSPTRGDAASPLSSPPGTAADAVVLASQALGTLLLLGLLAFGGLYIIGWLLARSASEERERLPSLKALPRLVMERITEAWIAIQGIFRAGVRWSGRKILAMWARMSEPPPDKKASPAKANEAIPSQPRLFVRYLFWQLLRLGERLGAPRHRSETAREYASRLGREAEEAEMALTMLAHAYSEARYSARSMGEAEKGTAEAAWKDAETALRRKAAARGGEG